MRKVKTKKLFLLFRIVYILDRPLIKQGFRDRLLKTTVSWLSIIDSGIQLTAFKWQLLLNKQDAQHVWGFCEMSNLKRTLEESVVRAMDGRDKELFPFLPYIFQDMWELGTSPETVTGLIRKHLTKRSGVSFLDLGCGKGAVSVKVAKEFGYKCLGVGAVEEFIKEARRKAEEFEVSDICKFKKGDIREEVKGYKDLDIVLLGSIGPVLGDYFSTLTALSEVVKRDGIVIIDDGCIEDSSDFTHNSVQKRIDVTRQIRDSGMMVVDEVFVSREEIEGTEKGIFSKISRRCLELAEKYPDKMELFMDYVESQKEEGALLGNEIICSTMVLREKM